MAFKKPSRALQAWMDSLPLADQPIYRVLELLKDPLLPRALVLEGLLQAAKFFSPTMTSSRNSLEGSVELKNQPVDRIAILSAIASLPTQAEREEAARRAATLFTKAAPPLLIEAKVVDNDETT